MENKVVQVGNFAASTDTNDLDIMFSTVGNVEKITFVTDAMTGRTRCLVEMSTPAEANDCVDRFHGQDLNGQTITVSMNVIRKFAPLKIAEPKKKRARKPQARHIPSNF